ncbi:MAG TPA: pseudouridine synthase [Solirubrobacteraceae bacterium]|jgi:23S rRNA pseudouridine2605 synthase|nr:pseudouridine synthase [Solirubrobacteraceae bacterium]
MRLAKHLAHAGIASRRAAERLIAQGRVAVGGEVVTDPARDVGEGDRVEVDGDVVSGPEQRVVYAVNKPLGVVSTARDTHARATVVELVPADELRLYPVGRLDADSSGLILLTNDGALAHRLTHPRYEVPKTYLARVGGGRVGEGAVRALRSGVELEDGVTAPARVRRIEPDVLELTIHEGRNRQVRRMCEAVGHPVLALQRIAFGPLRLDELAPGAHRRLGAAEIARLRTATSRPSGKRARSL